MATQGTNDNFLDSLGPQNPGEQERSIGSSLFDLDYFSGSQATIYIGDCFIDECTGISFSVEQGKAPIYGYASQLFDAVAPGNVIVQGSFSINFKESGYLWLVLQRYKGLEKAGNEILEKYSSVVNNSKVSPTSVLSKSLGGGSKSSGKDRPFARLKDAKTGQKVDAISRASIERLVSGEATKTERFSFYQDFAGYATMNNPNVRDKAFEDIVEVFEDMVWKDNINDIDELARRADDNYFDDFDLFVVYGDFSKPGANHTVKRIRNVHITSTAQQISPDGQPIQEVYSFIARQIL